MWTLSWMEANWTESVDKQQQIPEVRVQHLCECPPEERSLLPERCSTFKHPPLGLYLSHFYLGASVYIIIREWTRMEHFLSVLTDKSVKIRWHLVIMQDHVQNNWSCGKLSILELFCSLRKHSKEPHIQAKRKLTLSTVAEIVTAAERHQARQCRGDKTREGWQWVGQWRVERFRGVWGGCCDVKKNRWVHSEGKRTARRDGSVASPSDEAILAPRDPVSTEQIGKQ